MCHIYAVTQKFKNTWRYFTGWQKAVCCPCRLFWKLFNTKLKSYSSCQNSFYTQESKEFTHHSIRSCVRSKWQKRRTKNKKKTECWSSRHFEQWPPTDEKGGKTDAYRHAWGRTRVSKKVENKKTKNYKRGQKNIKRKCKSKSINDNYLKSTISFFSFNSAYHGGRCFSTPECRFPGRNDVIHWWTEWSSKVKIASRKQTGR